MYWYFNNTSNICNQLINHWRLLPFTLQVYPCLPHIEETRPVLNLSFLSMVFEIVNQLNLHINSSTHPSLKQINKNKFSVCLTPLGGWGFAILATLDSCGLARMSISPGAPRRSSGGHPSMHQLTAFHLLYHSTEQHDLWTHSPSPSRCWRQPAACFLCIEELCCDIELFTVCLASCLASLQSWMLTNKLKLNPDRTEFLLIGNEQRRSKFLPMFLIELFGVKTNPENSALNLRVTFDQNSFRSHILAVYSSCFNQSINK